MKLRTSRIALLSALFLTATTAIYASDPIHIVQRGETLYHIARMYGVSVQAIMQLNNIENPRDLHVGATIKIPSLYTVRKGDTLYSIARDNGIPLSDLLAANKLQGDHIIRIGETLLLPASSVAVAHPVSPPPGNPTPYGSVASHTSSGAEIGQAGGESGASVGTSAAAGGEPSWPSPGSRVYLNGKLAGGTQIYGKEGDPIVSVASGRVVWVGPYRGYGQVVFVESQRKYIYVYGGNESTSVHVGEQIAPGVQVATMGINPHLGQACMYFFVYKDGKPVNPQTAPRG
ncbi:MAG TPA: M23 family metallopeptidase [Spirochaetia bacterium]|nr:M23 family metallopeptidase [Spirochaetia bacterium]